MSDQPATFSLNSIRFHAVTATVKSISRMICRVDSGELSKVPSQGPLILVANHVNFLDAPIIYTHLQPRPLTGFAKLETWENPLLGFLFTVGGAIPMRRGTADLEAMNLGLQALKDGKIVTITPEGTRSGDGCLRRGHPGVVSLALHSGAPLLPLVFYGGDIYRRNLRKLKRTDFYIRVGEPYTIDPGGEKVNQALRKTIIDEIMCTLACLLPAEYRGAFSYCNPEDKPRYLKPI